MLWRIYTGSVEIKKRVLLIAKRENFTLVDLKGIEPSTSALRTQRSPNCATSPWKFGAGDRGRTGTVSLPSDFESDTSANSITPAL